MLLSEFNRTTYGVRRFIFEQLISENPTLGFEKVSLSRIRTDRLRAKLSTRLLTYLTGVSGSQIAQSVRLSRTGLPVCHHCAIVPFQYALCTSSATPHDARKDKNVAFGSTAVASVYHILRKRV
jgi:hypothetical protein